MIARGTGCERTLQEMPSGLSVLVAPTQAAEARTVVRESAARFGPLLASMSDVITVADCGRLGSRAAGVAGAGVAGAVAGPPGAVVGGRRRWRGSIGPAEAMERLARLDARVGVVVVGSARTTRGELVDGDRRRAVRRACRRIRSAPGLAAGAWTVGRGAAGRRWLRAARPVGGDGWSTTLTVSGGGAVRR